MTILFRQPIFQQTDFGLNRKFRNEVEPYQLIPANKWTQSKSETVFKIETHPDVFDFWKVER
jgi:hypothetical protein